MSLYNRTTLKETDVWIQDQTTPPFHYYMTREDKTDITLTSPVGAGDSTVTVSSGHGFDGTGESIIIQEGDLYIHQKVKSVLGDVITLTHPSDSNFTTSATVIRGSIEMNVNGSITPQEFVLYKRAGTPIDLQHTQITIWNDAAAGDDAKFGDLAELGNGLYVTKENSEKLSLGNYKSNSDFRERGATVNYSDKSGGGGQYGVDVCFSIKDIYGIVIRLDPDDHDKITVIIRDDLTDLKRLRVSYMGQYTLGE